MCVCVRARPCTVLDNSVLRLCFCACERARACVYVYITRHDTSAVAFAYPEAKIAEIKKFTFHVYC
jgi:hypothetical protein